MPLFESKKSRNRRLFNEALAVLLKNIELMPWVEQQKDETSAWFMGGASAAKIAIEVCPPLSRHWGKGKTENAGYLTIIFTLPMVLRFYRWMLGHDKFPLEKRLEMIESGLWNVLHRVRIPSVDPEETVENYMKLARQFNHEEDKRAGDERRGWHFIEMYYLYSLALTVLGQPSSFQFGEADFPVGGLAEFRDSGGRNDDVGPVNHMVLFGATTRSAGIMASSHKIMID